MRDMRPSELVQAALTDAGRTLIRMPGRTPESGLHEVKELAPSLRASLMRVGVPADGVLLSHGTGMANWNRATSQVDVVVLDAHGDVDIAVELKVWDIGHQLFDLAKVCCLLAAGARAAFLICVARRSHDFDRHAGGELFPAIERESREHDFLDLIGRHRDEWRRHVGKGRPEPISIPSSVRTTAVSCDVPIDAYPGHSARAVEVTVRDAKPVTLRDGWPAQLGHDPI